MHRSQSPFDIWMPALRSLCQMIVRASILGMMITPREELSINTHQLIIKLLAFNIESWVILDLWDSKRDRKEIIQSFSKVPYVNECVSRDLKLGEISPTKWLDEWDFEATASSTKDKDKLVNNSDNNRPNCATEFVEPCYTVWKPYMTF
jgi:hypothetical protein